MDGPGPAMFPLAALALLAAGALVVALSPGEDSAESAGDPFRSRTFLSYAGAMVAIAIALPFAGFIPVCFLATFFILVVGEEADWRKALMWSLCLTIGCVVLFGVLLGVELPPGPVEDLLASVSILRRT